MSKQRLNARLPAGDHYTNYVIARLALWAGDSREAVERLSMYRKEKSGFSGEKAFKQLATTSASRTLGQLTRRMSEFKSMYRAAEIPPSDIADVVLRSAAGHLRGVIWVESDRDFLLRAYLADLDWESTFYHRVELVAKSETSRIDPKGDQIQIVQTVEESGEIDIALSMEWIASGYRNMFVQIAVSPFCTLSARALWTARSLPEKLVEITDPFQSLLNEIDPKVVETL